MYQTLMQVGGAAPQAPWWQTPALMVGALQSYILYDSPSAKETKRITSTA